MREIVIDYVINGIIPVMETTISGQLYFPKIFGAIFNTRDDLMILLYLDFYRI